MALFSVTGTIQGVKPLLLSNFKYQHPCEPLYKLKAPISKKRNKTEEDFVALSKLDFLMSGHWLNDDGNDCNAEIDSNGNVSFEGFSDPYIPAGMLRSSIGNSSKALNNRKGAAFDRGVLIDADFPLRYTGSKICNEMWDQGLHQRDRGDRNGKLIWITRIKIPTGWEIDFQINCDSSQVEISQLEDMIKGAGRYIGVGSWRPENGGSNGKFKLMDDTFSYEEIKV
tara:strand:- start:123 stop:800 length:678 start_codon:yes stop_codon:yes gene_type:complete